MTNSPHEAIIAVTLNCNARCVMCNIWQNKIEGEVSPDFYHKLPPSLKEINITGGEPFLRNDLPEIVAVMKKACPQARLLINTNGYLFNQIKKLMPRIMQSVPSIALRISLDGMEHTHDSIRRLPHFYANAIASLVHIKKIAIKDLGVSYTLMEQNKNDLLPLYTYCEQNDLEFSLTVATDSPIYFGTGKLSLRPKTDNELRSIFKQLVTKQYKTFKPKEWIRAWFNQKLLAYMETHTRYFSCRAGKDFFYLDSLGRIYTCHLKPWLLGDLTKKSFLDIFNSPQALHFEQKARDCQGCWMVCTARSIIKAKLFPVFQEIVIHKLQSHLAP